MPTFAASPVLCQCSSICTAVGVPRKLHQSRSAGGGARGRGQRSGSRSSVAHSLRSQVPRADRGSTSHGGVAHRARRGAWDRFEPVLADRPRLSRREHGDGARHPGQAGTRCARHYTSRSSGTRSPTLARTPEATDGSTTGVYGTPTVVGWFLDSSRRPRRSKCDHRVPIAGNWRQISRDYPSPGHRQRERTFSEIKARHTPTSFVKRVSSQPQCGWKRARSQLGERTERAP